MRMLRMQQEEFIIRHLTQSSNFDIYAEMGKVCPTITKIPSIPNEELTGMVNSVSRDNFHCHPSPTSDLNETELMTEEQDCRQDCFPFNQPSINKFMEMEEEEFTWNYMEDLEQEIMQ